MNDLLAIQEIKKQVDKLSGLLKNLKDSSLIDVKDNASKESDIEMGNRFTRSQSDSGMDSFNKQIQEIKKQVDRLSGLLKVLKDANVETKSVAKASAMKAIRKQMEKDIDEVVKIARNVREKIEAINKENLANRRKPGCGKGTSVDRSRTNMTNALTKKFRDIMIEF
ncbi:hypothetical protein HAX54_040189 [Datura stramonium]|uniref:Syntaxin N-terminal domain-containing protein n=1 Tax=Datura stramonium TaxID=4076 RepID=A0ABS8VRX7_DATST|nr:hypothetical protein [Datura stramonium]